MTKLMGILNVAPECFSGKKYLTDLAVEQGKKLYEDGADILDIGGESARPGAPLLDENEEIQRVIPLIQVLRKSIPIPLAIDTCKPKVAAAAIEAGANLVNSTKGLHNPALLEIIASTQADVCIMHMQRSTSIVQPIPHYLDGVVAHLVTWFEKEIENLMKNGIKEKNIIIDPGIGFGKTVADNFEIIQNLSKLKALGFPLLLGISHKSFRSEDLNTSTSDALAITVALSTMAILAKTDIIRVHNVSEHRNVIDLMDMLTPIQSENLSR